MTTRVFTGFGFGPIQAGLFISEAAASGRFGRLVIAEVDADLIAAVRANGGRYCVNVANRDGVEARWIEGVELFHPGVASDKDRLLEALRESTEICTALPSVNFYDTGEPRIAALIAAGVSAKTAPSTLVYAAENNNYAAEILSGRVAASQEAPPGRPVQYLNTVIGKMSQVVTGRAQMAAWHLQPIVPGANRAFLVEAFNHILVSRCTLRNFEPGIAVFEEKEDLVPFEEAKLFGHNAIHALLAWLGALRGCRSMVELAGHRDLMALARRAFLEESGRALSECYHTLGDPLFTPAGWAHYAGDLLERMTNPYLNDTVERAARDTRRKLGQNDRIFGAMAGCLEYGIRPECLAVGAAAGLANLVSQVGDTDLPDRYRVSDWRAFDMKTMNELLGWLWEEKGNGEIDTMLPWVRSGWETLESLFPSKGCSGLLRS